MLMHQLVYFKRSRFEHIILFKAQAIADIPRKTRNILALIWFLLILEFQLRHTKAFEAF